MKLAYKKSNLVNFGRWIQPTLPATFWCHWHQADHLGSLTLGHRMHACLFVDGHSLLVKADVDTIGKIANRIITPAAARRYVRSLDALGNEYARAHLALLRTALPYQQYLPKLFSTYQNIVGLWWLMIPLGIALERNIKQQVPDISDEELFTATASIRPTWLALQNREVVRLAQRVGERFPRARGGLVTANLVKRDKNLWRALLNHAKKFSWFGTHHWMGNAYTPADCLVQIREALRTSKAPRVSVRTRLPSRMPRHLAALAGAVTYWRTHCAELTSKVVFLSRPKLMALADRWGLPYDDVVYLSHQEILHELGSSRLPKAYAARIAARKVAFGCVLDTRHQEHISTGGAFRKLLAAAVQTDVPKVCRLVGAVACQRGTVRGRVCMVLAPRDFKSFQRGDVLIANETTPDFVPLMKKAKAIVTDLGGMTSHASIVSRELGIPCVVGTKFATRVFRTGDRVEVNSQTGVITKLG